MNKNVFGEHTIYMEQIINNVRQYFATLHLQEDTANQLMHLQKYTGNQLIHLQEDTANQLMNLQEDTGNQKR